MDATFIILVSTVSFFIFLITFYAFSNFWDRMKEEEHVLDRLNTFSPDGMPTTESSRLFQYQRQKIIEKKLQKYLANMKSENWFQLKLYQSGLNFSLTSFLLGQICFILLLTTFFVAKSDFSVLFSVVFSIFLTILMTAIVIKMLTSKRHDNFISLLPLALDIVIRAIRAGHSLERTLPTVAREVPDPVGKEFQKISEQIEVGVSFEDAFREASLRVNLGDFYFFAAALIIQRQSGGSLAEILENIIYVLHRRQEIRLKAKALSAEGRITGVILGALPILFWIGITVLKPEYLEYFSSDPFGRKLLYTVIGLLVAQILTIRWMINVKVD